MWVLLKNGHLSWLYLVTRPGPWLHVVVWSGYLSSFLPPCLRVQVALPPEMYPLGENESLFVRLQDSKFSFSHSKFAHRPPWVRRWPSPLPPSSTSRMSTSSSSSSSSNNSSNSSSSSSNPTWRPRSPQPFTRPTVRNPSSSRHHELAPRRTKVGFLFAGCLPTAGGPGFFRFSDVVLCPHPWWSGFFCCSLSSSLEGSGFFSVLIPDGSEFFWFSSVVLCPHPLMPLGSSVVLCPHPLMALGSSVLCLHPLMDLGSSVVLCHHPLRALGSSGSPLLFSVIIPWWLWVCLHPLMALGSYIVLCPRPMIACGSLLFSVLAP